MKSITVFTPTYNRAYCLGNLYRSLCKQNTRDFEWLIIDDGSTDGTAELVQTWISQDIVDIRYLRKDNGGMHTGHNLAYENINTELNMCVDSDDFLPDGALRKIIEFWGEFKKPNWAGLIGLDAYKDGTIVGTSFPEHLTECKYSQLKSRYGVVGDKKFIYRTDVMKKSPPYPVFPGEKFVPLGYKYLLIDQEYDLGIINEILCIVEYMPDGSTKNIFRQYLQNPEGFAYERKIRMRLAYSIKERFKNAIHYVSCSILTRNSRFLAESPSRLMTLGAVPFGLLLNIYLQFRCKFGSND